MVEVKIAGRISTKAYSGAVLHSARATKSRTVQNAAARVALGGILPLDGYPTAKCNLCCILHGCNIREWFQRVEKRMWSSGQTWTWSDRWKYGCGQVGGEKGVVQWADMDLVR
jgi:hypothetical protein